MQNIGRITSREFGWEQTEISIKSLNYDGKTIGAMDLWWGSPIQEVSKTLHGFSQKFTWRQDRWEMERRRKSMWLLIYVLTTQLWDRVYIWVTWYDMMGNMPRPCSIHIEIRELSWCQLCCRWWLRRLSLVSPLTTKIFGLIWCQLCRHWWPEVFVVTTEVAPLATKLASWKVSLGFQCWKNKLKQLDRAYREASCEH